MNWKEQYLQPVQDWLLDPGTPGVRYLALRDLLDLPADDPQLVSARLAAHREGPISTILAEMRPEGCWQEAGPGYNPKYRSTVWSIILLAQLGASAAVDERISRACQYLLDHSLAKGGQFTATGAPSGTIDCLQGNLTWALLEMGFNDPRLEKALDWMARSVTGEGVAPATDTKAALRYYAGKSGPLFACGANNKEACGWGAVKVVLALANVPVEQRTPLVQQAMQQGIDFLLGVDPATAAYPTGLSEKPNRSWWKFGFPVFYITDILQIAEAMASIGLARDERMAHTLQLICEKRSAQGAWLHEYDYGEKTWGNFGEKMKPSKWVTLRALRVLKAADGG